MDSSKLSDKLIEMRYRLGELLQPLLEDDRDGDPSALSESFDRFFTIALDKSREMEEMKGKARSALRRFTQITVPGAHCGEFEPHRQEALRLYGLNEELSAAARAYVVFGIVAAQREAAISDDDDDLLHNTFSRALVRQLLRGDFLLPDEKALINEARSGAGAVTTAGEAATAAAEPLSALSTSSALTALSAGPVLPLLPAPPAQLLLSADGDGPATDCALSPVCSRPDSKPVDGQDGQDGQCEASGAAAPATDSSGTAALPPSKTQEEKLAECYSVVTEKNSFSVKSFVKNYEKAAKGIGGDNKKGDLRLLCFIANIGAATKRQLSLYACKDGLKEANCARLVKAGFVSKITSRDTGREFFALSKSGAEIFVHDTTRAIALALFETPPLFSWEVEPWTVSELLPLIAADEDSFEASATAALFIWFNCGEGYRVAPPYRVKSPPGNLRLFASKEEDGEKSHAVACISYGEGTLRLDLVDGPANPGTKGSAAAPDAVGDGESSITGRSFDAGIICSVTEDQAQVTLSNNDGELSADDCLAILLREHEAAPSGAIVPPAVHPVKGQEEAGGEESAASADPGAQRAGSSEMAQELLRSGQSPEKPGPFRSLANCLLQEGVRERREQVDYLGRIVVLFKALSLYSDELYGDDYRRFLHAFNYQLDERSYNGETLISLFSGEHEGSSLHLAALLWAILIPDSEHDYILADRARSLFDRYDAVFGRFPALKPLLNDFLKIRDVTKEGFSDRVMGQFLDEKTRKSTLERLSAEAEIQKSPPHVNQHVGGIPQLLAECFGKESKITSCMSVVAAGRIAKRESVLGTYKLFLEGGKISRKLVEDEIGEAWKRVKTKYDIKVPGIIGIARNKIIEAFMARLETAESWLNCTAGSVSWDEEDLRTLHSLISRSIADAVGQCGDELCLSSALTAMAAHLDGKKAVTFWPEDWLSSGVFNFVEGIPQIDGSLIGIKGCEPWQYALLHNSRDPQALADVLPLIDDCESLLFDNIGQAIKICQYLGRQEDALRYESDRERAGMKAEARLAEFLGEVELHYALGRISEQTKEKVQSALSDKKEQFQADGDYARLYMMIGGISSLWIAPEIESNRERWQQAVWEREKNGSGFYLERAKEQLSGDRTNFLYVEDELNKHDAGVAPHHDEQLADGDEDYLAEFIEPAYFGRLARFCEKTAGKSFGKPAAAFVRENLQKKAELAAKYAASAERLVLRMPSSPQENASDGLKVMLQELGFDVQAVDKGDAEPGQALYRAVVTPKRRNLPAYSHPIAVMGTRMPPELTIITLYGSAQASTIMTAVRNCGCRNIPIVILNGMLNLAGRRSLAEIFLKDGQARNPFILIDWPLLLHLAEKKPDERMSVLLACSLPYSGTMQLFSKNSSVPVADEMYIGRTGEIGQILDQNGPVIVYGGRQLGKTALLLRAKNLFHDPADSAYGVFLDVKNCRDEASFARLLAQELGEARILIGEAASVADVCGALRRWFRDEANRLLLLIDESDNLLAGLAQESAYAPLAPLEALCREANGRFKFVFAGLHNVCQAGKESDTIFGRFGAPLCIKPMSQTDAYRLLARPLSYLGFSSDEDVLPRLLINTNYYPGVVHAMGAEFITMLTEGYGAHYNRNSSPPYRLTEKQLGAIMNSAGLATMIEERIRMTVRVDPAYRKLAGIISLLYLFDSEKQSRGYSLDEILHAAEDDLQIADFGEMGRRKTTALLNELCDMSILVEAGGLYRFRLSRFLNIIGRDLGAIMEFMKSEECEGNYGR